MPTRQQTHIDRALTNISVAFIQDASSFIADKVFPSIPVQKQSDTYFEYDESDFFRDEAKERAKGTESAGGTYNVEAADPYFARVYAIHTDVDDQDRTNSDDPLRPDQDAVEFVSSKLLIKRETMWATKFFQTGVWGTEITGVATGPSANQTLRWDVATSDPVKVINEASINMAARTGKKPNTLVLSPYVVNGLRNHPDVLDRIKYTQKGIVTTELLASLFEVEHVHVPFGIVNSAAIGAAAANDFIMGKHALLMYVEKNPGLKKASAGYTFAWTGLLGAGAYGNRIKRIPMPWLGDGTERIEGEMAFDLRVMGSSLGVFFKDIVS